MFYGTLDEEERQRQALAKAWDEGQEHTHSEHCALGIHCNPYGEEE